MKIDSINIKHLEEKIDVLQKENTRLKALLAKAGINYSLDDEQKHYKKEIHDSNQDNRIIPVEITQNHARKFFSYFWGRMDVYSRRFENKTTGKVGYFPQCDNFWKRSICPKASGEKIKCIECKHCAWTKLNAYQIEAHLRGNKSDASDVIGIYPLFPDGTCRFLVFDFDYHGKNGVEQDFANEDDKWIDEVNALRIICKQNDIPVLVERSRSGKGAHLWIFFNTPIEASLARKFGYVLLDKGAESVNMTSFRYYDRMLPAQDILKANSLGNLVALPLQGQALRNGNSAFVDENWNAYPDQWKILLSTEKLSRERIESYVRLWNDTMDKIDISTERMNLQDDTKPWDRKRFFYKEDVTGKLHIIYSNLLYIETRNLKPRIQNQIRRMAAFSNPTFFKNNAIGLSNYDNPRYIYLGYDDNGYICIPRGLYDELIDSCKKYNIEYIIEDKRCQGKHISVEFTGELYDNQSKAVEQLLKYDNGILSAATGFGKTVVCSNIIAKRKTSTLILLRSSALVEQWKKALDRFLNIDAKIPEYITKTGKIKKRKSLIGMIQGAKDTSTGIVDVAMIGSLCKKGKFHPRLKEYGLVLVDECHHSASETIRAVLCETNAKYVYGVTATPFRGDGLEKINYMLLGAVRFQYSAKEKAEQQRIDHLIIPRFTRIVSPHGRDKLHVNDAYEIIRKSEIRNDQIASDIHFCIRNGRTPIVLTKYTEHATVLYERVKAYADKVFLLTGTISKKEQRALRAQMDEIRPEETMILIATGQLVGEGFDYPRLDTLIMATPVAWKGIVEQYAGRLNRDYEGKKNVMIYDYVDMHIPVFDRMYAKRLKAYKKIGYKLYADHMQEKQNTNAIYDSDTYAPVYEKDLLEAIKEIVISSPTLGKNKVMRMIRILKERQEAGVKVTIVTWHPDNYMYGRDEHRIELMEDLRNAGFHIELMQENCQHYAVIDNEIVWYGSMNLLSKDDVEDNIMRIRSKEIAAELLEITFKKENELKEYQLPI